MSVSGIYSPVDSAVSGMRAQSVRVRVISANIANAFTSRTPSGGPYRRQSVVLSALPEELAGFLVIFVLLIYYGEVVDHGGGAGVAWTK